MGHFMFRDQFDAIIVGGGPGGASCAYHLARAGLKALIVDRHAFPRDKSCGDGLTPRAVKLLEELGALGRLGHGYRTSGVRIIHLGHSRRRERSLGYRAGGSGIDYGLVLPRMELDSALLDHAVEAGASFLGDATVTQTLYEAGRHSGVRALLGARNEDIKGRYIVAADGAASRIAAAFRRGERPMPPGFAIRAYFDGIGSPLDRQEIYLPLSDPSGAYLLPSYGWVFPTGRTGANVGVGIFSKLPFADVRRLYDRFVAQLMAEDPRFREARAGKALGAPLRFDFNPRRCAGDGLLLVGDAAGLTSPFTGEGISYALESGRLAAEAIALSLARSPDHGCAEEDYALLMENAFAGYFEAGRRSAQRYQLSWHVLDSSFDSERPIFSLLRRAALIPEGTGAAADGALLRDVKSALPRGDSLLRHQIFEIGAQLIKTVRTDWPIVGRLELARQSAQGLVFRPSLLALIAARFGNARAPGLTGLGVGLDLVYLGFLAHSSVEEADALDVGNWSNKFAILCGDYLMARGLERAMSSKVVLGTQVLDAIERSCRGRVAQLGTARQLDVVPEKALENLTDRLAPAFSLPLQLGARVAGANELEQPLEGLGRELSILWVLGDELQLLFRCEEDPVPLLSGGYDTDIPGFVTLMGSKDAEAKAAIERVWAGADFTSLREPMLRCGAVAGTLGQMDEAFARSEALIATLPHGPASDGLRDLARLPLEAVRASV